jgi:hypothetical protein
MLIYALDAGSAFESDDLLAELDGGIDSVAASHDAQTTSA